MYNKNIKFLRNEQIRDSLCNNCIYLYYGSYEKSKKWNLITIAKMSVPTFI